MYEVSNSRPANRSGLHAANNTHLPRYSPQTPGSLNQKQVGNVRNTDEFRNIRTSPRDSKTSSASSVNLGNSQQSRSAVKEPGANRTRKWSSSAGSRTPRASGPNQCTREDESVASSVDGVVRTIDFNDDDTVSYLSSSSIRDLFQNVSTLVLILL